MAPTFRCTTPAGATLMIEAESEEEAHEKAKKCGHTEVSIASPHSSDVRPRSVELTPSGPEQPYNNLRSLASGMVFFASILKVSGILLAAFLCFVAFAAPINNDTGRVVFFVAGLGCGLITYASALSIAAGGEALLALADIALYTSRIPEPETVGS
jgi:hypothetical protein